MELGKRLAYGSLALGTLMGLEAMPVEAQIKPHTTPVSVANVNMSPALVGDAVMLNHIVAGSEDYIAGLVPGKDIISVDPMNPGKIAGNTTQAGSWYANSNNPFKNGREFEAGIETGYKLKSGLAQQIVRMYCSPEATAIDVKEVSAEKTLRELVAEGNTTVRNGRIVPTNILRTIAKNEIFFNAVADCYKQETVTIKHKDPTTGEEITVTETKRKVTDTVNLDLRVRCANGQEQDGRIRTKKKNDKPVNNDVKTYPEATTTSTPDTAPTTTKVMSTTTTIKAPEVTTTVVPTTIKAPEVTTTVVPTTKPKGTVPTTVPAKCDEFNPCTTTTIAPEVTTTVMTTTSKPPVAPTTTTAKGTVPTTVPAKCDEFNPCAK